MYNRLLKPPYQNWWWRRQGINGGVEDTTSPIDPADLSPVNHYTELTHVGGDWEDNITAAEFDSSNGVIASTHNSLACWLANGTQTSNLRNTTGTTSIPFDNTDQDLTFYFVMSTNRARSNSYAWQFIGSGTGSFFGFFGNDFRLDFNFRDDSNNTCTAESNVLVEDPVYVFAVKIKNVSGACTVDLWQDGIKLTQGTQSTFTALDGDGLSALFNLYTLNFATNGKQCELAFFTDEHSETTVDRVNQFLMAKWGISPPVSPLDAPDADFLHWMDFSDNDRLEILSSTNITKAYFGKLVDDPVGTYYIEALSSSPKTTGVINTLQAANFEGALMLEENPSVPAGHNFIYPSMTWFVVVRPTAGGTKIGDVISDYGTGSELIFLRVGDGTNLLVHAWMRDASANVIEITSGTEYLSLNTDYLLVCRFDGVNKRLTFWIDGATSYTDTNASYDNTTTWAGGAGDGRMGMLSQYVSVNMFQGYIGSAFVTKTALSNADINAYANWMASKWGIVWTQI